ncbi:MAG: trypsin-like peptidase domain-containing protein [Acidobacteria bacterium]|nr:trypsin-like peptidase domain-containing protein [Acidobacteriota bacterium]
MRRAAAPLMLVTLIAWQPAPSAQAKRYTVPDLTKAMAPAVVFIGNVDGRGQVASIGSGFVVDPDGVIVTNYHVIEGASALQVKMKDGEIYDRVEVLDHDQRRDIAVLKIRAFKKLPVVTLASEAPEAGEEAIAIGNPQGLEHTVSVGVVSAYRQAEGYRLIQISVPISPGSSGGPLFNIKGEVIGITSAGVVAEGAQNLNFAVPIDYARPLIASKSPPVPIAEFSKKMGAPAKAAPSSRSGGSRSGRAGGSDEPLGAWRVVHDHGDVFENFCVGVFYFTEDKMGFTNDSHVHVWEVPLSALKEIGKNAVYGADKQAFHVRLVTNTNYNFVAVNDQLQFQPSDPIILGLMAHTKK